MRLPVHGIRRTRTRGGRLRARLRTLAASLAVVLQLPVAGMLAGALATAIPAAIPARARAQDIGVRAQVDRQRVRTDGQVMLQIIVDGRARSVEEPERPPQDDFEVYGQGRSQSMQIVNGEVSASTTFSYILVPKREGKFTVGPFTVRVGGKEYKTQPVTIDVTSQPVSAGGDDEPAGREVFVAARVDKPNAYVNEQVLYTFFVYRAVEISNTSYTAPKFEGFWVEKLRDSETQSYRVLNGRRYVVHEVRTALFPTTSGKAVIEPARLSLVMVTPGFGFSLFDRGVEKILRSKAVEVNVSPLPVAGKPGIFDGAVGEGLQLRAKLDRHSVAEGDPLTLTVTVEGTGNVKTFSRPRLPDLPEFKTYDSDSKTDVQAYEKVAGTRTWEIVLVPRDEGDHTIGPIRLAYFDTAEGKYRTLETKPEQVTVVKSANSGSRTAQADGAPVEQQDIRILGRDIAHIHADVTIGDQSTPLFERGAFAVLGPIPLLAAAGATWVHRRRRRFASDVALARASRARKLAAKRLTAARRAQEAGEGEKFYAEIQHALRQYVGDKLNVSAAGLTHDALREALTPEVPAGVVGSLLEMLERCDAARFAPGSMGMERLRETLEQAEALLVSIDSHWGRAQKNGAAASGAAGTAVVILLCALAAVHPAAAQDAPATGNAALPQDFAPPAEWVHRGNEAYEAGRFTDAIAAYRQAETLGVRSGALYYNLGNAYYKSGDLGHAIACYRRGEFLSPRDKQLRANLEFARARREDKSVEPAPMPLVAWAVNLSRAFSMNEWIAFTAGLYTLLCALWIARMLWRAAPFRSLGWAIRATAVLTAVAVLFTVVKVRNVRGIERAVVGDSRVAAMSGPGTTYTAEFSLHEGAEVRVQDRRSEWVHIAISDKLHGWVPARSLITI